MVIDSASKLYLSLIYCLVKFVLRSSNMISFLVICISESSHEILEIDNKKT